MRTRTLLIVLTMCAIIGASLNRIARAGDPPPKPEAGEAVAGLQLDVSRGGNEVVEVTFQNVGEKPMVLNLGMMLGNGRTMIPDRLGLIVAGAAGESRQYQCTMRVAGIAGRVDDFLVPLMPGAKYLVSISFDDFFGGGGKPIVAVGEKVQAVYEGKDPSFTRPPAIPALPAWIGKIESAPITYVK